jgi:hypothetical protein
MGQKGWLREKVYMQEKLYITYRGGWQEKPEGKVEEAQLQEVFNEWTVKSGGGS